MNQNLVEKQSKRRTASPFFRRLTGMLASLCMLLLMAQSASASHYRYGSITWNRVNDASRTVTFTVNTAWRSSFFVGVSVGATLNTGMSLNFGDASAVPINMVVTSVNATEDWFTATFTTTHTYAGTATSFDASYLSNARLGTLQNNANGNFSSHAQVMLLPGNIGSPVSTLPPIVNVAGGNPGATFNVPSLDPDASAVTYALATNAEFTGVQPAGLSINSASGIATFNTVGKAVGTLWNGAFSMVDQHGSKTIVDFLIRIVTQSTPPFFNYAITPNNNTAYSIQPGQTLAFDVEAADVDPGSSVTLTAVGLPTGVTFNPVLPAGPANPVTTNFSWTPTNAQLGVYVISFVATDNDLNQATTTITINVNLNPIFIAPTPPATPDRLALTGVLLQDNIAATNPDPNVQTQISGATLPAGASLSPALPTAFATVATTTMSWTPTPANWGPNTFTYTATDANNQTANHSYVVVANTLPVFTSAPAPVVNAPTCAPFSMTISATDADLLFGDDLEIESHNILPSWLTLTDNGDGTATLSGLPAAADVGTYNIELVAADIYHHSSPLVTQSFTIFVVNSTPTCSIAVTPANNTYTGGVPTNIYIGYGPQSATLTATGSGGGPYNYSWSPAAGLSCTNCQSPVFTPTAAGYYTFTATATNQYGCTTTCEVTFCVKDIRVPGHNNKVYVCHVPPGNPSNAHTLSINVNAVPSHLTNHNDHLGACGNVCDPNKQAVAMVAGIVADHELELSAYPNPFNNGMHLLIESNTYDHADVIIYDVTGRILVNMPRQLTNTELTIGQNLAAGVYTVEVREGSMSRKIKIVKTM